MSIDQESFETGRMLAKKPQILEKARRIAKQRGKKKVSEVVSEALELYEKLGEVTDIDMATFMKSIAIYRMFIMDAVNMLSEAFALFNTDVGKKLLKMMLIPSEETIETTEITPEEKRETTQTIQTQTPAYTDTEEITRMRKEMLAMMMNLVKTLLSTIMMIPARTSTLPQEYVKDLSDIKLE